MAFRGTFEYTLDSKNRLTVPARFRPELAGGVVLSRATDPCVSIWTSEDFEKHVARTVDGLHVMSDDYKTWMRFFNANSFELELDSAGRVMIPGKLIAYAGLDKDVVVIGVGDLLEVWNRDTWNQQNDDIDIAKLTARFNQPTAQS
jgi:MraZ protein